MDVCAFVGVEWHMVGLSIGGAFPHRRELNGYDACGATSDREGRDGVNPSSTHLQVVHGRCVDVGLAPARPLRSLGSHASNRAALRSHL